GKSRNLDNVVKYVLDKLRQAVEANTINSHISEVLLDPLTARELEVLRLVVGGDSNREIARRLVLALGTVKWYISDIYSKLGVTNRVQAVSRTKEMNLL
ncbi:MAG TPA: LuxR C-terminal-related transcriptional regulator, partial [Phototrophicaceae bacterium]|nr:LuxR C-terminal-related transcriptional regulator [Phototrophicaceae bacterium]